MSDQSIRIIFTTQYLENYGAHDWDGEGECPQYWKPKGGSTYIVACTPEQLASRWFYSAVEDGITKRNDYEQEYVVSSQVVDACDFVESDFVEFWESPINVHVSIGGDLLMEHQVLNFTNEVVGIRRWVQNAEEGLIGTTTYQEFAEPVVIDWRLAKEMELHGTADALEELESLMEAV
jgi:hypothetical protein